MKQLLKGVCIEIEAVTAYYDVSPKTVKYWVKGDIISGCLIDGKYKVLKEEFEILKAKKKKLRMLLKMYLGRNLMQIGNWK